MQFFLLKQKYFFLIIINIYLLIPVAISQRTKQTEIPQTSLLPKEPSAEQRGL